MVMSVLMQLLLLMLLLPTSTRCPKEDHTPRYNTEETHRFAMHIINAFLRFTSLGVRKIQSAFTAGSLGEDQGQQVSSSSAEDRPQDDERSSLLEQQEQAASELNQASFTDEHYHDFYHSFHALRLFFFHVALYYTFAVVGFSVAVEHWTVIESFYFATVLATTIGYGDLYPLSEAGKVCTIFLALYGVVILGIFLGVAGEFVVDLHNEAIRVRHQKVSSAVVKVLATDEREEEDQVFQDRTKEELREKSIWEDIFTVVLLEAPMFFLLLICSLGVGYLEGWSILDSTYWLVITGVTIGLGDMHPSKPATQIFSCFFFPLLVAVLGELLARIASVYMERKERISELEFLNRTLTMNDIYKMDTDRSGEVDKAGEQDTVTRDDFRDSAIFSLSTHHSSLLSSCAQNSSPTCS